MYTNTVQWDNLLFFPTSVVMFDASQTASEGSLPSGFPELTVDSCLSAAPDPFLQGSDFHPAHCDLTHPVGYGRWERDSNGNPTVLSSLVQKWAECNKGPQG